MNFEQMLNSNQEQGIEKEAEYNEESARKLIEQGKFATLSHELLQGNYPEGALSKRLAMSLLDKNGPEAIDCLVRHLKNYYGLDEEVIDKLIALSGNGSISDRINSIAANLDVFEISDYERVAKKLVASGESWNVLRNWEKFRNADLLAVAKEIVAKGDPQAIVSYWEKFSPVKQEVLRMLPENQRIQVEKKV